MIQFLFFFCLPLASGYDCSYQIHFGTFEEVNEEWFGKGLVGGFYNPNTKIIYLSNWNQYEHEWRHAFCQNHFNFNPTNHDYCISPHFKVMNKSSLDDEPMN